MVADKGFYGVDYRSQFGLHRTAASGASADDGSAMWDCYVGPLPFIMALSEQRPYVRKSVAARRERLDQAREPGENSLDNGMWLRSQTSWHLGAGQAYAEPLEESPDIARFRFADSAGVDPWTPGQLSLLPVTTQRDTGVRRCVGVPGVGLIASTAAAGVRKFPASGASTQISTKTVSTIVASDSRWYGLSTSGLEYGDLSGATGAGAVAAAGATALHWGKDRLWLGVGAVLYEITTVAPSSLPTATHTFRAGSIADIDSGAGGTYVLVNGQLTSVFVISAKDDGTLNAPREVLTLPRGETGVFLYGYLGRYLVIGTNKGVRVADCSQAADLPVGPIIVSGACYDAVGDGEFIWVSGTVQPDPAVATYRPGLVRLSLANVVSAVAAYGDSAAARYAYATDVWAETTGSTWSVSVYEGILFLVAGADSASSTLWQRGTTPVDRGWVQTGQISFSTSERKAWTSITLEAGEVGYLSVEATTGGPTWNPVTQTEVATPYNGDLALDSQHHPASGWLAHRVHLVWSSGSGPVLYSVGLRALPAPTRRARRYQIPLECFDWQLDRYGNRVGYRGFAFDRVADLEALETSGELVQITDRRSGEVVRAQIEDVQFDATTAPSRVADNYGGTVMLTLLVV